MKTKQQHGFTVVEIIIVLAVVAVLAALVLPNFNRRVSSGRIYCTNNLKQVGLAFRLWSGDNNDHYPMELLVRSNGVQELVEAGYIAPVFNVMSNELCTPKVLLCPNDQQRKAATSFSKEYYEANISYFLGMDATETNPQMFLTGDDNIEVNGKLAGRGRSDFTTNSAVGWSDQRHKKQGNVGLADGSVQGFSSTALRTAIRNTGTNVNRLVFP